MSKQYPYLFTWACRIAVVVILAAGLIPEVLVKWEFVIASLLILGIGLPHGASDYLIYRQLSPTGWWERVRFLSGYLGLMFLYGCCWVWWPVVALLVFIGLSVYHFGQSNWENIIPGANKWERVMVGCLWGSYVLGALLFIHQSDVISILSPVLNLALTPISFIGGVVALMTVLGLLVVWMYTAVQRQILSLATVRGELLSLAMLSLLFLTTPLLIGFAIYFTCWHAVGAMQDQIRFFRFQRQHYNWRYYLRDILPLSLVAIAGLLAWVYWQTDTLQLEPAGIGWLFAFIAMLTLPHLFLIERLFDRLGYQME